MLHVSCCTFVLLLQWQVCISSGLQLQTGDSQHVLHAHEHDTQASADVVDLVRPALSGGNGLVAYGWPFSRLRKIFFRGRIFQENP